MVETEEEREEKEVWSKAVKMGVAKWEDKPRAYKDEDLRHCMQDIVDLKNEMKFMRDAYKEFTMAKEAALAELAREKAILRNYYLSKEEKMARWAKVLGKRVARELLNNEDEG